MKKLLLALIICISANIQAQAQTYHGEYVVTEEDTNPPAWTFVESIYGDYHGGLFHSCKEYRYLSYNSHSISEKHYGEFYLPIIYQWKMEDAEKKALIKDINRCKNSSLREMEAIKIEGFKAIRHDCLLRLKFRRAHELGVEIRNYKYKY